MHSHNRPSSAHRPAPIIFLLHLPTDLPSSSSHRPTHTIFPYLPTDSHTAHLLLHHHPRSVLGSSLAGPLSLCATHYHSASAPHTESLAPYLTYGGRDMLLSEDTTYMSYKMSGQLTPVQITPEPYHQAALGSLSDLLTVHYQEKCARCWDLQCAQIPWLNIISAGIYVEGSDWII